MSSAYLFAFAAILAVIPILLLFKMNIEKIKENPDVFASIQTKFFIGVAISEVIPLILLVFGMMDLSPAASMEELYLPGLIVILAMAFAPFFIVLQRSVGVPEEAKQAVNTFSFIGIAVANAIPLISLVCLIMMLP
jgi:F0F1-type ATP synthase membrane subunit c/vacuolar-type H+-ATPase subunit K